MSHVHIKQLTKVLCIIQQYIAIALHFFTASDNPMDFNQPLNKFLQL